jgi:hypothetical protein
MQPWLIIRKRTIHTERPPRIGEFKCQVLRLYGGCVVSATGPHGRWSRSSRLEPLLFVQVLPQLSSRGWLDPVPDPALLRKSIRAGNRTRNLWLCSQELLSLDHRGSPRPPARTHTNIIYIYIYIYIYMEETCRPPSDTSNKGRPLMRLTAVTSSDQLRARLSALLSAVTGSNLWEMLCPLYAAASSSIAERSLSLCVCVCVRV